MVRRTHLKRFQAQAENLNHQMVMRRAGARHSKLGPCGPVAQAKASGYQKRPKRRFALQFHNMKSWLRQPGGLDQGLQGVFSLT